MALTYAGDGWIPILSGADLVVREAGHDWHTILRDLGWLTSTDAVASGVRAGSVCLFAVALGLAALGLSWAHGA